MCLLVQRAKPLKLELLRCDVRRSSWCIPVVMVKDGMIEAVVVVQQNTENAAGFEKR